MTNPGNLIPVDPTVCPLCGRSNRCARAADPNSTKCWCGQETFPPELLEKVPDDAVRKACICLECLESHREAAEATEAV